MARVDWRAVARIVGLFGLVCAAMLLSLWWTARDARGDELPAILQQGDKAPEAGLLLSEDQAKRAVEEIRDARALAAQVETLKAALAAKDQALAEAGKATRAQEIALAIAEDREKRRAEYEEQVDKVIARMEKALQASDKALDKSGVALDRAEKRIENLETRAFWQALLGPLGLVVGLFLGAGAF